jgi:hypothetical protein
MTTELNLHPQTVRQTFFVLVDGKDGSDADV